MDTSSSSISTVNCVHTNRRTHTVNVCRCLSADHEQILSPVLRHWWWWHFAANTSYLPSQHTASSGQHLMTGSCWLERERESRTVRTLHRHCLAIRCAIVFADCCCCCCSANPIVFYSHCAPVISSALRRDLSTRWKSFFLSLIWHSARSKLCLDHITCTGQTVAEKYLLLYGGEWHTHHCSAQHAPNHKSIFCLCVFAVLLGLLCSVQAN